MAPISLLFNAISITKLRLEKFTREISHASSFFAQHPTGTTNERGAVNPKNPSVFRSVCLPQALEKSGAPWKVSTETMPITSAASCLCTQIEHRENQSLTVAIEAWNAYTWV